MFCPYCNADTSLISRQRSTSGANVLVILCSHCQKILGVVNDPSQIDSMIRRHSN
jgi:hypothetical protein